MLRGVRGDKNLCFKTFGMIERNWKEYNENLVKRGEIWISKEILQKIKEKNEEENKRGRPYKYKSNFIKSILILKNMFRLPYRQRVL